MSRSFLCLTGVAAMLLAACGGSDEPAGTAGSGGGTVGTGGVPGTGGTPGTGGIAGTGGTGASGGTGGDAGAAGQGGAPPVIPEARSSVPHNVNPDVSAAEYEAFIADNNDFGLELYLTLAGDENLFYSPVSTSVALAMTYAGARNNTATQMAQAMHITLPDATYHAAFNKLAMDLASRNIAPHTTPDGDKSLRLSLLNAAWAQQNYNFIPAYLDRLSENYDAGVYLLDFIQDPDGSRNTINGWVSYHTQDRISELIGPDAITPDTRLVLTNALYFYGTWNRPFDEQSTSDEVFHAYGGADVTVATMHATEHMAYGEGDGYQMLDIPYDGAQVMMTLVLPEAGRFGEIRGGLTNGWLETARAGMTPDREVRLAIPKFSFTWGTESFKAPLQAMGVTDAFVYPTADFTGIEPTRELFISDVLHQAFVGVDEHGTEAAAATAVVMWSGAVPDPMDFTVDRPFIFFIRDTSGAILFVGQVLDPTA